MAITGFGGALLFLALAAGGCSGAASPSSAPLTAGAPASTGTTVAPTTTTTPSMNAAQLVAALAGKVPTAHASVTYTADTDPNHLLGRPGGYDSKSTFTDSRVSPSQAQTTDPGSVDLGGSVEAFSTAAAATARGKYILGVTQTAGFLGHEYDCASGGVLLRLSFVLTPDQAKAYQTALGAVTGSPCTPPA